MSLYLGDVLFLALSSGYTPLKANQCNVNYADRHLMKEN